MERVPKNPKQVLPVVGYDYYVEVEHFAHLQEYVVGSVFADALEVGVVVLVDGVGGGVGGVVAVDVVYVFELKDVDVVDCLNCWVFLPGGN